MKTKNMGLNIILSVGVFALATSLSGMNTTKNSIETNKQELFNVKPLAPLFRIEKVGEKFSEKALKNLPKEMLKAGFEIASKRAFEALKAGKLELFDALCSDTACQIRVPLVIELYKRYRDVVLDAIHPEDRIILARLFLLTAAKRLEYKVDSINFSNNPNLSFEENEKARKKKEAVDPNALTETIGADAARDVLKKRKGIMEVVDESKTLVSKNALTFLQQVFESNKEFQLPSIEIAPQKKVSICTTPCTLSILALTTYLQECKIPLILRGCSNTEEAPFVPTSQDEAMIDTSRDDQSIFIFPQDAKIADADPVCIIDGVIGDKNALINCTLEKLMNEILIPNAAQHPQLAGEKKKYGNDLRKLNKKEGCKISESVLGLHEKALEKAKEALKVFSIRHIMASTYKQRERFVPLEILPRKKSVFSLEKEGKI